VRPAQLIQANHLLYRTALAPGAWQRFYIRGTREPGGPVSETHRPKRRLSKPVEAVE
jgi:hypothetical protein